MVYAFWTTYGAVLGAEIVGDKFLYTTGILATRYRTTPMMLGIAIAFMVKMGVAVAIGQAIGDLPRGLLAAITMAGVAWVAVRFWRGYEEGDADRPKPHSNAEAAVVSFASVLSSEWGDLGQLTAAAMVVQFRAPMLVWAGAVIAMMTKALLVATIGATLRGWLHSRVPAPLIRYAGLSLLLLVGGWSVAEALLASR